MALDVLFLKGTAAQYNAINPKDDLTFYYTTDDKNLYIGGKKLSSAEDLEKAIERITKNEEEIAKIKEMIGNLQDLTTDQNESIVKAINEVQEELDELATSSVVTVEEREPLGDLAEADVKAYDIKQDSQIRGTIEIPKDKVIERAELVTLDATQIGAEGKYNGKAELPGVYLQITIKNDPNIILTPLKDVVKVAADADEVQLSIDSATNTLSAGLVDSGISTGKIKDSAVTESKIADGAVTNGKIANNAVTADKLATDSVVTDKIQNGAVTEDKLATDSVSTDKIQDDAVTKEKLSQELQDELGADKAAIGKLESLTTEAKSNLVDAINEVDKNVDDLKVSSTVKVVEEEQGNSEFAKIYDIRQGDNSVGKINIPKDLVVESAIVVKITQEELNEGGKYAGEVDTPGTYIVLTIANKENDKVYINVGTLVDIYTALENAEEVQVAVDNDSNKISASIVTGSIGKDKLKTDLQNEINTATSTSKEAQQSAAAAQSAAEQAAQEAEATKQQTIDAIEEAEEQTQAAKTAAEAARDEAKQAQTNAETARTGAEAAQDAAKEAQTGAETARDAAASSASDASTSAEAAKKSADSANTHDQAAAESAKQAKQSAAQAGEQAELATTAAEEAADSAKQATEQAGLATSAAERADASADDAQTAADNATREAALAEQSANDAQTAADSATGQAAAAQSSAEAAAGSATKAESAKSAAEAAAEQAKAAQAAAEKASSDTQDVADSLTEIADSAKAAADAATETANGAKSTADAAKAEAESKAPKNHASTGTEYGAGSTTSYGHVKLSNTIDGTNEGAIDGVAASPAAVKSYVDQKTAGLSGAMHYKGQVETLPSPTTNYSAGDVITVKADKKEYICEGSSWRELGDESSYALKTTTVNTHPLSSDVTIAANEITTGVLAVKNGGTGNANGESPYLQPHLIPNNSNLNDFTPDTHYSGLYYCNVNVNAQTLTNCPTGNAFCMLLLKHGANGSKGCIQIIFGFQKVDKIWYRTLESEHSENGWGSWVELYTKNNKPTPAEIGAVNKTGDTMTGPLEAQGGVRTHYAISNSSANGFAKAGYIKICTIEITDIYVNVPICFSLLQRRMGKTHYEIHFTSANNKTPALDSFYYYGHELAKKKAEPNVFIASETATTTGQGLWAVYVEKAEPYDAIEVVDYVSSKYLDNGIKITWTNQWFESYPEGAQKVSIHPAYATPTPQEVGALPAATNYAASASVGGPANSVAHPLKAGSKTYNGTADVTLTAADVGALPSGTTYAGSSSAGGIANSAVKIINQTRSLFPNGSQYNTYIDLQNTNTQYDMKRICIGARHDNKQPFIDTYDAENNVQENNLYSTVFPPDATKLTGILPVAHGGTGNETGKAPSAIKADTATTATTATKLGSSNVGSATQAIYLEAGTPKAVTKVASAASADSASKFGTSDVGNATTPIYLKAGVPTAASAYPKIPANYAGTATAGLVPPKTSETASTALWLNETGKWSKPTPSEIGAAVASHTHTSANITDKINITAQGSLAWNNQTDGNKCVTLNTLAYWNGLYDTDRSNLRHCALGAFGSVVTHNATDFANATHTHNYAGSSSAGGVATSAAKVAHTLTFKGGVSATFDGSADTSVTIPSELTWTVY